MPSKRHGSVPRRGTFASRVVGHSRLRTEMLGRKSREKFHHPVLFRNGMGQGPHYSVVVDDQKKYAPHELFCVPQGVDKRIISGV